VTEVSSSPDTPDPAATGIDTTVPHSARIWNYWLGGTDNYTVDRAAGDQFSAAEPGKVLQDAGEWLDLTRPVALTFMGVLGHVTDHDEARAIVAGLLDGLASGSYLAINDSVNTSEALEEALRVYEASGAVPYRTRSVEQFAGYFDGLELVEPGVVLVADWRPDPSADRGPEIPQMGGVGRKP